MRVLRQSAARVLADRDVDDVLALLHQDPVANVFVISRVEACGLNPGRLGGEMWGYSSDGRLVGVCHAGANLVPAGAGDGAVRAFADRARRQGRRCSSIVGPADLVRPLWSLLAAAWRPARDVRDHQPLMAASALAEDVRADPAVRRVRMEELDTLLPACVAMFTEEVGVSPLANGGGPLYRARVAELVGLGRAFARIEGGRVVFKAEIGAATRNACQVQGVWVDPPLRGRGFGTAGMASVLAEALRSVAPTASLYVNAFNEPAVRAYRRVGFHQVGTFMSVLF
jgi:predicted GNAT family acetyltransferase